MINKTVLNVGSGKSKISQTHPAFKNWKEFTLDLYEPNVDFKTDIVTLKGVEDESMDVVFASHVIEHIFWHQLPECLKNLMRVVKKNGYVIIQVPDLESVADLIKKNLLEPIKDYYCDFSIAPLDIIYGSRELHFKEGIGQTHKTGFTLNSLTTVLNSLNINAVIRRGNYQVQAVCFKDVFPEQSFLEKL